MADELKARCMELLVKLELASDTEDPTVTPLTGGVASDIALVDFADRQVVVKFPLTTFRVAEEWHAPAARSRAEYGWLKFAGRVQPGSAPRVLGYNDALRGLAMEYVHGDNVYLWKSALLEHRPVAGEAARTGAVLGRIHAASTAPEFDADSFQNQDDFFALRLEPYLAFTATVYPDLEDKLRSLIRGLTENATVLIHGDVSPKNILIRDGQPVFLDAECATMGDACFDVAFCLNHLVLKSVHMPDRAAALHDEIGEFWMNYKPHVAWEDVPGLEARVCDLLPALMLARVDGKSPVEYLDAECQERVRALALPLLADPPVRLDGFLDDVFSRLGGAAQ